MAWSRVSSAKPAAACGVLDEPPLIQTKPNNVVKYHLARLNALCRLGLKSYGLTLNVASYSKSHVAEMDIE